METEWWQNKSERLLQTGKRAGSTVGRHRKKKKGGLEVRAQRPKMERNIGTEVYNMQ